MATTVNKREIIQQVAEQTGVTQTLAREVVQKLFDTIIDSLAESGLLELRDFGVFEVQHRPARKARNPLTGETVMVPEKDVVTFKPGKAMGDRARERYLKKKAKRK